MKWRRFSTWASDKGISCCCSNPYHTQLLLALQRSALSSVRVHLAASLSCSSGKCSGYAEQKTNKACFGEAFWGVSVKEISKPKVTKRILWKTDQIYTLQRLQISFLRFQAKNLSILLAICGLTCGLKEMQRTLMHTAFPHEQAELLHLQSISKLNWGEGQSICHFLCLPTRNIQASEPKRLNTSLHKHLLPRPSACIV